MNRIFFTIIPNAPKITTATLNFQQYFVFDPSKFINKNSFDSNIHLFFCFIFVNYKNHLKKKIWKKFANV